MKYVTLDDLRTLGGRVVALPAWSYQPARYKGGEAACRLSAWRRIEFNPPPKGVLALVGLPSSGRRRKGRLDPPPVVLSWRDGWRLHKCVECRRRFYGLARVRRCSDACQRRHRAEITAIYRAQHGRSDVQHVEHRPRKCAQCGERFTPTRSDAIYCGTRCRVAAHRAR